MLGGHVANGAAARSAEPRGARECCHAKVGQLDVAAVVDKHVRRLDVEVEYAVLVREGQRLDEGIGNAGRLIVRE